ncbi:MAG: FAD-dependent oxidoreductase [Clostridia bacterium]|nr:FAD-dependent oxidoreductase [Clostridia bacterium]
MDSSYPNILSPLTVRGHEYRNRVEFGPTLFAHSIFTIPEIKENVYRMVEDRAKGGAAAVSTGEICVNFEEGITDFAFHKVDYGKTSGDDFEALSEYARRIKKHGAVALFEVCHEGCAAHVPEGISPWGPDEFVRADGVKVLAFDRKMMRKVCRDFKQFGAFAAAAGFDGVLLHGGHGFLLQQFVSPGVNHRTDRYGGSAANRARFPKQIIKALRKGLGPDGIIELRFSATDGIDAPGAMTIDDTVEFAKQIDGLVDIFHVSNGLKEKGNSTGTFSSHYDIHGVNVEYARRIKAALSKTLVSVIGGLNDPQQCEDIIASGAADIVVFGRQGFADPEFVNKVIAGKADRIRRCVRCFNCYPGSIEHSSDRDFDARGLTADYLKKVLTPAAMGRCTVNPDSGFGRVPFDCLPEVKEKKKVLVIGGGPAGMQAAITASQRGHDVTLIEKDERLGGTVRMFAEKDPHKQDLLGFLDVLEKDVRDCAAVITAQAATPEFITGFAADVTLIATGSVYKEPVKTEGYENLTDIRKAYTETPEGKNVIILGGGMSACETAVFLAEHGCRVKMIIRSAFLAKEVFGGARNALLTVMEKLGIEVVYEARFKSIEQGVVNCVFPDDTETAFSADIIYGALGSRPNDELYRELILSGLQLFALGDAQSPGKIVEAVHDAYDRAVMIGV